MYSSAAIVSVQVAAHLTLGRPLQVPFIWTYRRDYLDVLSLHHLWKIVDLDAVYVRIQHAKKCVAPSRTRLSPMRDTGARPRVARVAGCWAYAALSDVLCHAVSRAGRWYNKWSG